MESSHHVNKNSTFYRKAAVHRTEIERLFLAGNCFITNLVHYYLLRRIMLLSVTCTSSLTRPRFPTYTNVHLNGIARTISRVRKIIIDEGLLLSFSIFLIILGQYFLNFHANSRVVWKLENNLGLYSYVLTMLIFHPLPTIRICRLVICVFPCKQHWW